MISSRNGIPGKLEVNLIPGYKPPIWSCQPPPVPMSCSNTNTSLATFSLLSSPSVIWRSPFTTTAARMLEVPNPLPWGSLAHVWICSPMDTRMFSWTIPVTRNADLTIRNGSLTSNGGVIEVRFSTYNCFPASSLIRTPVFSVVSIMVPIGGQLSKLIVIFKTPTSTLWVPWRGITPSSNKIYTNW